MCGVSCSILYVWCKLFYPLCVALVVLSSMCGVSCSILYVWCKLFYPLCVALRSSGSAWAIHISKNSLSFAHCFRNRPLDLFVCFFHVYSEYKHFVNIAKYVSITMYHLTYRSMFVCFNFKVPN